jgi:Tfp pilus assembly PilM family ATPase
MISKGKTGWIGFDIGASSVKAAQIVRRDGGYCIRAAAVVPRRERWSPAALVDDQPKSSAGELMSAASLCDRLTGATAAAMMPAFMCDMVQMDVPTGKRPGVAPDLVRAVEAETQRSLQNRVLDTWPIAFQPGKINVVTAPRAWSDQISSDVAAGGWNCRLIDALPWALARAASLAEPDRAERNVAVLDWGYAKATMCLVHQGAPALVRSLKDCAFQDAVRKASSGLHVDERDAEILLQKYGVASAGSEAHSSHVIADMLAEPLSRLAEEIRRTLGFWQGVTRGHAPRFIYLFGGGGTIAGVGERLSKLLGLAVEVWRLPPEAADGDGDVFPACLLGAAVGLSALAWEAT